MRDGKHGCGQRRRGTEGYGMPEGLLAMVRGARGGWGGFDWDFGERGQGHRGRRRMFEGGELRLVLLKLIAEEPRHGYDLIRAIEDLTGGEYAPSPGVIYPTLTLLQDMGLIQEAAGEGPRKNFQATADGRQHLEERAEEVEGLLARLKDLAPSRHAEGASPIWRAMRNLGVAIRHRVQHGEVSDETKFELAALIDELAQKIERLK
ncbi:DNA-binding PadR family transcriptional regulator [Sphingomonas sp. F9_3S_D5_B_2]